MAKQRVKKATAKAKAKAKTKEKDLTADYLPLSHDNQYYGIDRRILMAVLVVLSVLLYANTIPNEYALDDGIVVTKNEFTKQGLRGIPDILGYDTMAGEHGKDVNFVAGGRYRPLSVITLAIEYELFDENPHISHFVNALLYGLTAVLIFLVLERLLLHRQFRPYHNRWYLSLPFVAAFIFAIHPVHTEVVANIKGRDEIMTLMGALGAFWFVLRYHETDQQKQLAWAALVFFLGLLSKENAITFLAVIPIGVWFFTPVSLRKNLMSVLPLLGATVVFLILRRIILGANLTGTAHELMNNPFVYASVAERYATVFLTFGKYLLLLVWPHPLTWDYYPYHIPLVDWADWRALLPLLLYMTMGIYALLKLRKKQQIYAFAIWTYLATLSIVSNLFFSVGTFMSERFLYLPSLGFALALAYLLANRLPAWIEQKGHGKKAIPAVLAVLVLLTGAASAKIIDRNFDWKNNFVLFTHDVQVSENSAKGNTTAGEQYLLEAIDLQHDTLPENDSLASQYFNRSMKLLRKAIDIHPRYIAPRLDLGIAYHRYKQDFDRALDYYISTLKLNPNYEKAYLNIKYLFEPLDSVDFQLATYERLYEINPNRYEVNYTLGSMYGAYKNNLEKAIFYLEKAHQVNPKATDAITDLGVAYGMSGQLNKAIKTLEKAVQLNTQDPLVYANLSASYNMVGNNERAAYYKQKENELRQRLQQQRAAQSAPQ